MTHPKLRHNGGGNGPPPVLDLRLLVLLSLTGFVVWLSLTEPTLASAMVLGLSVLFLLHQMTR
ncbi:MAG TPA: hypothetical protein VNV66_21680 [Pilimelia sp.]|nr:hypothetical protein [Pilimelia sp.]